MKHDQTKRRLNRLSQGVALLGVADNPEPPYEQRFTETEDGEPVFESTHLPTGGTFRIFLTPAELAATSPKDAE